MLSDVPRVVIAGDRSGTGKSTVTIGLLMALKRKGLKVQPFKTGPDFLDPMHHTQVTGRPSRNLDTWMFPGYIHQAVANGMQGADLAVVEGVMGMYDGFDGRSEEGSTAHLAKVLDAPVVLVLDARASARSIGAVALGFRDYDKEVSMAGVIFNNVAGPRHMDMLVDSLRGELPCLGGVPRQEDMGLESRHLGLVPAGEVRDPQRYEAICESVEKSVDLDQLLTIAHEAPGMELPEPLRPAPPRARLGVAMDEAFNFYYQDNMDILRSMGAEIVPFSPLHDGLPDIDGLYFGGGYPELFAEGLERNVTMREAVRSLAEEGKPLYAECGGLMYVCSSMKDLEGREWRMTGIFDAQVQMTKRLEALGYVEAKVVRDNILGRVGDSIRGHVFHYSKVTGLEEGSFAYDLGKVKGITGRNDGLVKGNVLASYTHLHFGSNPDFARRFVDHLT